MAAEPKVVRGSLDGVTVQTSQEVADALGSSFEPEKSTTSRSSSSKSSK